MTFEPSPAFAGEGWVRVFFFSALKKTLTLPPLRGGSLLQTSHVPRLNP